ncbi:MAG: DMT family transporter [Myxococcota bacterium]|nr:DMT family transporter [Myxococcota bacterium]
MAADPAPLRGYAALATAATLWGCWALFLRPAQLSGPAVSWLLFLVMALPAPWLARRPLVRDRRSRNALLLLGLCDAANAVLYFEAIRRGPLAVAVLTHYLCPLLVALVAPWFLGEPRSRRALVAAPLALLGLGLVIYQPGMGFPLTTALLGGASAVFYAANVIASKVSAQAYSAVEVTSLHSVIALGVLTVVFRESALPPLESTALGYGIAGTLVCGLFATVLFNLGVRKVPAHAASALTYLEPLTAAIVGAAFFADPFGPAAIVGTLLVLGGGAWVAMERAAVRG